MLDPECRGVCYEVVIGLATSDDHCLEHNHGVLAYRDVLCNQSPLSTAKFFLHQIGRWKRIKETRALRQFDAVFEALHIRQYAMGTCGIFALRCDVHEDRQGDSFLRTVLSTSMISPLIVSSSPLRTT